MRIAFFGLPLAALLLLEDGHELELALLSFRHATGRRRLERRIGRSKVFVSGDLNDAAIQQRLEQIRPDLVVSWFWTRKLPMRLLSLARRGGIGAHPSLLPRHRGPDPYFAAIDQGDQVTGVTVHRIDAEYDTGAVLARRELRIDPTWNAWQLARRLDRPSLALLRDVVGRLARGEPVPEEQQDESCATWAPEPADEDCALCWKWPTVRILRRIRALSPSPGAFTEIGGEIVTVTKAGPARVYPRALAPGEAAIAGDVAVIRTADHAIELLAGELDEQPLDRSALARLVARAREKMIR